MTARDLDSISSFVRTVRGFGLYERYRNIRTTSIPKSVQNNIGVGICSVNITCERIYAATWIY